MHYRSRSVAGLLVLMITAILGTAPAEPVSPDGDTILKPGEAIIYYLGHSGWAVKTRSHFLIFDYWERGGVRGDPSPAGLAGGKIDPVEIRALPVVVFISHAHGDHYDPVVFTWQRTIPDITYVFGWPAAAGPNRYFLGEDRESRTFGDLTVHTIHHAFDGIPEAAFLVEVDGLSIFHSGDHGCVGETINPVFKANIDYLAGVRRPVDLVFMATFGSRRREEVNKGDLYTIRRLAPRVLFPMHHGGTEADYLKFRDAARRKGVTTPMGCASRRGDRFRYRNGRIEMLPTSTD